MRWIVLGVHVLRRPRFDNGLADALDRLTKPKHFTGPLHCRGIDGELTLLSSIEDIATLGYARHALGAARLAADFQVLHLDVMECGAALLVDATKKPFANH